MKILEKSISKYSKGTKSLLWRFGAVLTVAALDFVAANLGLFNLPIEAVGIVGLILGELTKQLRTIK